MDACTLANTGGLPIVWLLAAAAAIVVGLLLVVRGRGARAASAIMLGVLVVSVQVLQGPSAMAASDCPKPRVASTAATSAMATPTPTGTATPTVTPTGTPTATPTDTPTETPTETPNLVGQIDLTWSGFSQACLDSGTDGGSQLYLVDDAARTIVWTGTISWASGGTVIDDLPVPGTYRPVFSDILVTDYPADGVFYEPGFTCTDAGGVVVNARPGPFDPLDVTLTGAAPNGAAHSPLQTSCNASDKSPLNDTDADGIVDGCDLDSDNDGIPDSVEDINGNRQYEDDDIDGNILVVGTLGDGVSSYLDLDSENDGILDLFESGVPATVLDVMDSDDNGVIDDGFAVGINGLADILETSPDSGIMAYPPGDTDDDGQPDFIDMMSDGTTPDLYAIGRSDLDLLGGGFISTLSDTDRDGIQSVIDTALDTRGAPGSPRSPYWV